MAETKLGQDAVTLPVGTTAQRPSNPEPGMIRFNTDEGYVEWYDDVGDRWLATSFFPGVVATGGTATDITQNGQLFRVHTFTSDGTLNVVRGGEVDVLIVGGGGGAGGNAAGGAGAGGLIFEEIRRISKASYAVTVGPGGSGGSSPDPGGDSKFDGMTAIGGGEAPPGPGSDGRSGGSGSGASQTVFGGAGLALQPGSSDGGFGNDGGAGNNSNSSNDSGAGGGGAGEPGADSPNDSDGGDGGDGLYFGDEFGEDLGENGFFAGGGAGGSDGSGGVGGLGGGADSGGRTSSGNPGMDGTGGGASGGGDGASTGAGADGGSGIVIVRYRIG